MIEILKNGHTLIIDTLKNIDSLMEIDVAISWTDFPSVLREISQHADIIALKEDLAKKAEPISQMDQIKMGMMVQAKLKERNTQLSKSILESIVPICSNIKLHEVMNDEMILKAAFLLNKNNQVDFETKIDQVDKQFEGKLNFKLVGPLPCYSFYTLYVENLESRAVIQAKNKLGLPEETTEAQIKKAYLDKAKLSHPDATNESDDVKDFDSIKNAYQTLLTYASAVRQTSSDKLFSLITEEINKNLILVKIKE